MSYNLINSTTLAMMEGEPRTTVAIVPLHPVGNPEVYPANSGNTNVDILFDKPYNVSDFWVFDINIYVAGMTQGANYQSGSYLAALYLLDDDGIAATDSIPWIIRQTGPVDAITSSAFGSTNYNIRITPTTGTQGTARCDGFECYLGTYAEKHENVTSTNGCFPASGKIGGVRMRVKTDYDVQTCGVVFSIGGIQ